MDPIEYMAENKISPHDGLMMATIWLLELLYAALARWRLTIACHTFLDVVVSDPFVPNLQHTFSSKP